MPLLKYVHIGTITVEKDTVSIVVRASRHLVMYELNNWVFDFSYTNNLPQYLTLPPLDDWTHSTEDASYWHFELPDHAIRVTVRTELLEFS